MSCILLLVLQIIICCTFLESQGISYRCRRLEFRCANSRCIPKSLVCDGKDDCGDKSDEKCENQNVFTCSNNLMIPKTDLCNGKQQCSDDEDPRICMKHKCAPDAFLCRSKSMNCINMNSVCNNIPDCEDESDESPEACEFLRNSKIVECNPSLSFRCADKTLCVSLTFRCDGAHDCLDKSDEVNCPKKPICRTGNPKCISKASDSPMKVTKENSTLCKPDEFYCGNGSTTACISNEWVCDSSYDCSETGHDEDNCPDFVCPENKPNKCQSHDMCYEDEKKCDGFNDCKDRSDEINCPKPPKEVSCDPIKQFKCAKNNTCIDFSRVCDSKDDCGDSSDERPGGYVENCQKTPCKVNNGDCEQICVSLYHTRKCQCKPGFLISPTNETKCVDINECNNESACSHNCTNTLGSFKCECFEGFYKSNDNGSLCKAVGEKFLLYSSKNSIRELRLLHHYMEELNSPNDKLSNFLPVGIDFDYKSKLVFWSQFEPNPEIIQIQHSFAKTKNMKQISLVNSRIHSPVGLAYDWIHGLLFWTDIYFNEISVLNITNGMRKTLLKLPESSKLRAIVVHPKYRRIYWSDWGTEPKIESMGMDGSGRKIIVRDNLVTPNGLALDYYFNELYWVDARARNIKSFNLKTQVQKEIVSYLDGHGFDIDIFEDWIYLTDWHKEKIIQIHKKTGQQKVLISSPKPMGLKLFHQLAQSVNIENVCLNNHCQYLCLPSAVNLDTHEKYRCLCPDSSELIDNATRCSPVRPDNLISVKSTTKPVHPKSTTNVFLIVGFVTTVVIIIFILAILLGIITYRNYMRKVIKISANFTNPTYHTKSCNNDIHLFQYDIIECDNSSELIPRNNQFDEGLQM